MTLEDVAKESEFTTKSLKLLIRLKVIHAVPTEGDIAFLSILSRIWKDKEWLKESLQQIRSKASSRLPVFCQRHGSALTVKKT